MTFGSDCSWGGGRAPRNAPPIPGPRAAPLVRSLVAAAIGALAACATDPNAPPDVAFDHVACTHCGMLVSEPAYAAALDVGEGHGGTERLVFDDAGCLFRYVAENAPPVARMWFHQGDTPNADWTRETATAFTVGNRSPMGSGLRAVPVGTPDAVGVGAASSVALGGGR